VYFCICFYYSKDFDVLEREMLITDQDVNLGNTGIKVSTLTRIKSNRNKYALLRQVQTVLDGSRFAVLSCQKCLGDFAQVMRSGDDAYISGVITCKSVWTCPVCAERIA